jgi:hypothetical protein
MTQMQGSVFTRVLAFCVYKSNLSIETVLFAFHLLSLFLILLGCWMIGSCFTTKTAVWSGLLLVTAVLTIPVAGTALYIVDQDLHPRAMATSAILFAIAAVLDNRVFVCRFWLIIAVLIHPLMAIVGISYVVFLAWRRPSFVDSYPAMIGPLGSVSPGWSRAARARSYYFVTQWAWYEWLGVALPIALVWWFIRLARLRGLFSVAFIYQRLLYFGLFQFAFALALTIPPPLLTLSALQPMRWMQLFYLLFFLLAGGLIGEFLLRDHAWRWVMLFVPLFAGMFYTQRQLFPSSSHIEIGCGKNDWCQAFDWVRENTPQDAYFALNPRYVNIPGEDHHGFRSWAERSMLEEESQDAGAATVFPGLLDRWYEQSRALDGWQQFELPQFISLRDRFGVHWALLERDVSGLSCPYRNRSVRVCRIP